MTWSGNVIGSRDRLAGAREGAGRPLHSITV
jgi:hypothetical protein